MKYKMKYDLGFRPYQIIALSLTFVVLYLTSYYSYLLFHSLVELFSIVIACAIFMIAWNGRNFLENDYLMFLGIAYLYVGMLDVFHLLAYKGMGVFDGYGADLPTQFWVMSRFIESISLLLATIFIKRKLNLSLALFGYLTLFSLLLASVFVFDIFPSCYSDENGLTIFKQVCEIVISLIFVVTIVVMVIRRRELSKRVFILLIMAICFSIASEIAFMLYLDVYGPENLVGHYIKIISFFLVYKAIIETGFKKPFELLFKNISDKTDRITEQKEMLEDINLTKDKFFSIIAHDLRSPFNALLSSSNMLSTEFDSLSQDDMRDLSDSIHNSAKKLFNLLNNLLQWSRTQIGSIEFKPDINDIYYLTLSEISLMTPIAEEKNIKLICEIDENSTAFFDENMINTVLKNLISNGIKFSNPNSEVKISAEYIEDKLRVSVSDSGIGIEEENLAKLFRIDMKFIQSGTNNEEGTGLGLILCKEFVVRNGGEISVESEIGKGSKFSFTIPAKEIL